MISLSSDGWMGALCSTGVKQMDDEVETLLVSIKHTLCYDPHFFMFESK